MKTILIVFIFTILNICPVLASNNSAGQRQKICEETLVYYKKYLKETAKNYIKDNRDYNDNDVKKIIKELEEVTKMIEKNEIEMRKLSLEVLGGRNQQAAQDLKKLERSTEALRVKFGELEKKAVSMEDQWASQEADKFISFYSISVKAYPYHVSRYADYFTNGFEYKDAMCQVTLKLNSKSNFYKKLIKKIQKKQIERIFTKTSRYYGPYKENYDQDLERWYDNLLDWEAQGKTQSIINDYLNTVLDWENSIFFKSLD